MLHGKLTKASGILSVLSVKIKLTESSIMYAKLVTKMKINPEENKKH